MTPRSLFPSCAEDFLDSSWQCLSHLQRVCRTGREFCSVRPSMAGRSRGCRQPRRFSVSTQDSVQEVKHRRLILWEGETNPERRQHDERPSIGTVWRRTEHTGFRLPLKLTIARWFHQLLPCRPCLHWVLRACIHYYSACLLVWDAGLLGFAQRGFRDRQRCSETNRVVGSMLLCDSTPETGVRFLPRKLGWKMISAPGNVVICSWILGPEEAYPGPVTALWGNRISPQVWNNGLP